jgi:hypothetical protein
LGILDSSFQFESVREMGTTSFAVAGVASGVGYAGVLGVAKVLSHLGLQSTLDQALGQLLEQAVFSDEVFRFFVASEQLVDQFVADGHGSSF